MDLKLFSAEVCGTKLQLTYTDDGLEPTDANQSVIVRLIMDGSLNRSVNWHRMNFLERIHRWADQEFARLQKVVEKND